MTEHVWAQESCLSLQLCETFMIILMNWLFCKGNLKVIFESTEYYTVVLYTVWLELFNRRIVIVMIN